MIDPGVFLLGRGCLPDLMVFCGGVFYGYLLGSVVFGIISEGERLLMDLDKRQYSNDT